MGSGLDYTITTDAHTPTVWPRAESPWKTEAAIIAEIEPGASMSGLPREAGPLLPVHGVTWQPEVGLVSVASGRLTLRLGRPAGYYAYVRLTTLE